MDGFIESVVATADHVKAIDGSDETISISFDEWNVWYIDRYTQVNRIEGIDNWPVAPRARRSRFMPRPGELPVQVNVKEKCMTTIAITECDHDSFAAEREVTGPAGAELVLSQSRTSAEVVANAEGADAILVQSAQITAGSTGSIRAHISSLSTSVRVIDAGSRLKDAQLRRHTPGSSETARQPITSRRYQVRQ